MAVVKEKTIKELCRRVAATHMLDKLDDDTVVAYQDLIGHATMEENKELSNDSALMETFYWIYGAAYGTMAAIKFYMQNSNKVENILAERDTYKADYEGLKETKRLLGEQLETAKKNSETLCDKLYEAKQEIDDTLKKLKTKDAEIVELKAKLYDAMQNK